MRRILDLTGALARSGPPRRGPPRPRPPLLGRLVEAARPRLAPQHSFDAGGLEETVEWYRENRDWWEPIKSGDYQRYYEQQYATRLAG